MRERCCRARAGRAELQGHLAQQHRCLPSLNALLHSLLLPPINSHPNAVIEDFLCNRALQPLPVLWPRAAQRGIRPPARESRPVDHISQCMLTNPAPINDRKDGKKLGFRRRHRMQLPDELHFLSCIGIRLRKLQSVG